MLSSSCSHLHITAPLMRAAPPSPAPASCLLTDWLGNGRKIQQSTSLLSSWNKIRSTHRYWGSGISVLAPFTAWMLGLFCCFFSPSSACFLLPASRWRCSAHPRLAASTILWSRDLGRNQIWAVTCYSGSFRLAAASWSCVCACVCECVVIIPDGKERRARLLFTSSGSSPLNKRAGSHLITDDIQAPLTQTNGHSKKKKKKRS